MKIVETKKEQCEACGLPTRPEAQLAGPSGGVYQGATPQMTIGIVSKVGYPISLRFTCARCGYQWDEPTEATE